jgi:hypothetical protein
MHHNGFNMVRAAVYSMIFFGFINVQTCLAGRQVY